MTVPEAKTNDEISTTISNAMSHIMELADTDGVFEDSNAAAVLRRGTGLSSRQWRDAQSHLSLLGLVEVERHSSRWATLIIQSEAVKRAVAEGILDLPIIDEGFSLGRL